MQRTTAKERRSNAVSFHSGTWKRAVVVIQRTESKTNPYIKRCKLLAVISNLKGDPAVIGESVLGKAGALFEFLSFLGVVCPGEYERLAYENDVLNDLLEERAGFRITYDDGSAMIFERNDDEQ